MIIQRLQIEGGFLNGLDLTFSAGLNVLIGARGTGKTSVIELLRYAVGAKNHTEDAQAKSKDHALAVLDDGIVSVTLSDGFDEIYLSRAAGEPSPSADRTYITPIVLSQTEIETIGLSESGRLALLDAFIPEIAGLRNREAAARNACLAVSKEISSIEKEVSALRDSLQGRERLHEELLQLRLKQAEIGAESAKVELLQLQVEKLTNEETAAASSEQAVINFSARVEDQLNHLQSYTMDNSASALLDIDHQTTLLSDLGAAYAGIYESFDNVRSEFSKLAARSEVHADILRNRRQEIQRQLRKVRAELEQMQEGSGAIAKQLSTTQLALGKIVAIEKLANDRNQRLTERRSHRNLYIQELGKVRQEITDLRISAADKLNSNLSPYVSIEVEPQAQHQEYSRAVASALRGSGLKYNDLAAIVASTMSPFEILEMVDNDDFERASLALGVQRDRAMRMLAALREHGMGEIATSRVEDNASMRLLDGVSYKDVSELSAGQRCTVVLSVVLQHRNRTLVIDQPEDHLDNSFITNTVIRSLQARSGNSQLIISTHNANIPVLGNADLVVELTSDGRNGFVETAKPLEHEESVAAISNIMEGGRGAFLTRARFYSDHID